MTATERITQYTVSILTKENCTISDYRTFDVTVDEAGSGLWAVRHLGSRLSRDGEFDYEPLPSSRTEAWKVAHTFRLDEALEIAKRIAPFISINGRLAQDFLK